WKLPYSSTFGYPSKGRVWRGRNSQGYTMMLYGYNSSSKYGKYHYREKGLLYMIPSIRYEDGNFIIPEEKKNKVINFLKKNNASYRLWGVTPTQDEPKRLKTN
ncbi:MAG: hypothetical protein QW292_11350, partial [Candidatus Parvarchaeota archaeon]